MPGFAKLVREARIAKNWSMNELARQAEVSPMCISELEAMKRSPSLRIASKIARALGLPNSIADCERVPKDFIDGIEPVGTRKLYFRKSKKPGKKKMHVKRRTKESKPLAV